jgi:YVTN family beta-propeller protein
MNLDDRGLGSIRAVLDSVSRVNPAARLEDLRRRRRRRLVTRTVTAIATATALALVAWAVVRGPSPQPTVAQPPASLGRVTATIPVGAGPVDTLVAAGAVWVANAAQGTVSRIDPATNTVTGTIPVGRNPVRLAAGFGSVWVANETSQTVSRLDARTGQLQATIPVTSHVSPTQLTIDTDAVWVKSGARLWRLDPATNTMTQRTGDWEVGSGELAVVDGRLWLSGTTRTGARQIVRVDPSTSRVVDRFPTGGDGTLAVGGGSVWQAGITTQTIYRYDPTSRRLLAQIPIGVVAKHLAADAASLWVSSDSGHITRIDMATSKVTGTFRVGGRAPAVVVGLGSVWIVDTNHAALLRLQPTGQGAANPPVRATR